MRGGQRCCNRYSQEQEDGTLDALASVYSERQVCLVWCLSQIGQLLLMVIARGAVCRVPGSGCLALVSVCYVRAILCAPRPQAPGPDPTGSARRPARHRNAPPWLGSARRPAARTHTSTPRYTPRLLEVRPRTLCPLRKSNYQIPVHNSPWIFLKTEMLSAYVKAQFHIRMPTQYVFQKSFSPVQP